MKQETTKRGWLLGLLVGLVMLIGASPAMAGYIHVGDFLNSWTVTPHPGFGTLTDAPNTFNYTGNNKFYVNGTQLTGTDYTGNYGDWSSSSQMFQYIIIKQAQYGANPNSDPVCNLYKYSATGNDLPNLSSYFRDGSFKISHVTGYNPVPIPGAVWLLGSGLSALLVARRRRRQI